MGLPNLKLPFKKCVHEQEEHCSAVVMENHGEKETSESLDSVDRYCHRVVGFNGWGLFNSVKLGMQEDGNVLKRYLNGFEEQGKKLRENILMVSKALYTKHS